MSKHLVWGALVVITSGVKLEATLAHHSVPVNYLTYQESPLTLNGTVKEVYIRNPHSSIVLDVVEQDGTVVEWLVHWTDGNTLRRRGAELGRIKPGEFVSVSARKHRRVPNVAYFRGALLPDGSYIRGCDGGIYRENDYYATCDRDEAHYGLGLPPVSFSGPTGYSR